ncbi:GNAT family N-acetyltransferase [Celeribacter litoreus]|uniref:GNAT family N-acetyltransferase n=1 Tax=Celeribacter litoreus TaxID=2876714 RepID=UPI001CC923B4|nr:GNAT family N-acetyltransferase [Celeribacter litoreus]MCA0042233.1 GNAT family N-acetyltransferase [Celeribacter litoreus]
MSVFWPHRARDIELFLSLGHGYIACDEIGRPLGSAMYFPMGGDFAMFGMMVVTPRLQAQGVGGRLLRRIMRDCEGRDLRLTATRSGFRLYDSAGFTPVAEISQHQGIARHITLPELPSRGALRKLAPSDTKAILALDAHAYGADRNAVYSALLEKSKGVVLEENGEIKGFALSRNFGKGVVIGPVVAEDDLMAMQLTAMLIQPHEGKFLRCDTWVQNEEFRSFLSAAGLGVFDTVTEMCIGPSRRSTSGARLFGMASHSLG